jgi:hypothetical protein
MAKMPQLHVQGPRRDFVGYGRRLPRVIWPDEPRVAVSFVINYEEGSEVQMGADGRNESILGEMALGLEPAYRDLALESVYEYGSRAGVWRLASLAPNFLHEAVDRETLVAALRIARELAAAQPLARFVDLIRSAG